MQTWIWPTIIVLAVVIVALVLAAWVIKQRRQSQQLHETFGPEYDRAVSQYHSQNRAEADLMERQKRVEAMTIRPLTPEERARFTESWRATQARFVDEPGEATAEADRLVADVMGARGYPVHDFEQRASDISVDHPDVVENYRAAHASSLASERGEASTEDLRTAMIHYRALFDELLETGASDGAQSKRTEVR
jgi:FtsZ-interacting cell division protein ZipA